MRVELRPERVGGIGVNVLLVIWRIACGTSRSVRSVRRVWIRPASGRRVVGSEELEEEGVSSSESWDWDCSFEELPARAMGLRRGREEKAEEGRRALAGLDFLMRLECAAVVWKDIVGTVVVGHGG